jgi:hypothetical protein
MDNLKNKFQLILSQNNTCLENNLPEFTSDNQLNASGKLYNFFSKNADLVVSADEKEFEKSIELELNKFICSNDSSYSFQEDLSRKQRCIIHSVSEKLKLSHQSKGLSPARFIVVSKIGGVVGEKTTRKLISADLAKISVPKIPISQHVSEIIQAKVATPKRTPKKRTPENQTLKTKKNKLKLCKVNENYGHENKKFKIKNKIY